MFSAFVCGKHFVSIFCTDVQQLTRCPLTTRHAVPLYITCMRVSVDGTVGVKL